MTLNQAALEKAAEAIWDTWCVSPAGQEMAPEGGALSWAEMERSACASEFPILTAMADLVKKEACACITAYLAELSKTHAIVPREFDEGMLAASRDWSARKYGRQIGNDAAIGHWNALIAEIDAREAGR